MHNRPDFVLLAFNQLVTHAAKFHFMDNGQTTVPMVVWAAIGRGWGSGAQHSQAIQGMLLGVPGPEDRDAEHAVRRQGPAALGDPRQQSGLRLRASVADEEGRHRAGWLLSGAARQGHLSPARRRRDDRRRVACDRAGHAGGGAARRRGHRAPKSSTCARSSRWTKRSSSSRSQKTGRIVAVDTGVDEGRRLRRDRLSGGREGLHAI